jgi:ATP-dependent DNA helicase RecQ
VSRTGPSNLDPGLREPKGRIAEDERLEPGRALSVIGDGGWGRLARDGRYEREHFDDELVAAAAELIRERWAPDPAPTCGWRA